MMDIRQATLTDVTTSVGAIAQLKQAVWPEEATPNQATVLAALQTATHKTFLAFVDEQPAGFVSCFTTHALSGDERWEIDLLAVHPDFRRRGIAGKLVETAVSTAPPTTTYSRALIEVTNLGSQRSFARHGFQTTGTIYTLNISTDDPTAVTKCPPETYLVPVNTFNYCGLWIEGQLSLAALRAGQTMKTQQGLELVGTLIPEADLVNNKNAQHCRFDAVGRYQWWELAK